MKMWYTDIIKNQFFTDKHCNKTLLKVSTIKFVVEKGDKL